MKRIASGLLAGATVAAMAAGIGQPATAVPADDSPPQSSSAGQHRPDNRPGPLTEQHDAMRRAAVERLAQGTATLNPQPDGGATVQLADDRFVEFPAERSDRIFTILAEFGDQSAGRYGTTPGPLHNEIAEPDRTVDNSTKWTADFDPAYYLDMFNGSGESMKTYYEDLSSGRYTVTNEVSEWVTVPYNASYYGDNAREDVGGAWDFIKDAGNAWYEAQLAASKTPAEIDAYLSQFDVWDRYDFDGDGNFTEPDGYIDHFQAVHAGIGEDAGGGAQGADAIWSHRWYVNGSDYGQTGPTFTDGAQNKAGGAQIGDSKYWLGDYTTEPENGGLGVFSHEFGHDLGLPDLYDTAGGDNGTAFWTLMSGGSWLNHGTDSIGTTPGYMGPWEKLQLGWLDYKTVPFGTDMTVKLGPAD
ncbi:MAG TPA: immune inhibitor A domain-containing protein, partial [Jiangellaceae bacterium]|nr:immune inhibitor A domain-containing protein [Jiangellaceae bacterium]